MTASKQHVLVFSKEEYEHFRAYLKTQVIMKKDQVFGFIIDDMILDEVLLEDRGEVLRFKLAYMPPWMRRLDVHVSRNDAGVSLNWTERQISRWEILPSVAGFLFMAYSVLRSGPAFGTDLYPIVFIIAMILWMTFTHLQRRKHLREGNARFAAAMQSITDRAKHYAEAESAKTTSPHSQSA